MVLLRKYSIRLISALVFLAAAPYLAQAQQPLADGNPMSQAGEISPAAVKPRPSPAKPPHISCQGDQLTIVADNSTMSSIFTAIHACIGVDIQVPKGFDDDRTFIALGPAPARDVLSDLLGETDFDYVIQSSVSDARKIQSVQVTARVKDARDGKVGPTAANLTMTPARRLWLASRNMGRSTTEPDDNSTATDSPEPSPPASDSPPFTPVDPAAAAAPSESNGQPSDQKQDQSQSKDQSQDNSGSTVPSTTAPAAASSSTVAVPAQPPDSSDSSQTAPAPSVLQKQINQMEQMFEQRKQMIAKPAPAQAPDSNQN